MQCAYTHTDHGYIYIIINATWLHCTISCLTLRRSAMISVCIQLPQPEVTKLGVIRNPSVFQWYAMSPSWKFVRIIALFLRMCFTNLPLIISLCTHTQLYFTIRRTSGIVSVLFQAAYHGRSTIWQRLYLSGISRMPQRSMILYTTDKWRYSFVHGAQRHSNYICAIMNIPADVSTCLITNFIAWYRPKSPFVTTGTSIYYVNQLQMD